jgi:hypothetical protein
MKGRPSFGFILIGKLVVACVVIRVILCVFILVAVFAANVKPSRCVKVAVRDDGKWPLLQLFLLGRVFIFGPKSIF